MALAGLLVACAAWAHPFATRETAHGIDLRITAEAISVQATLEVPVTGGRPDVQALDEIANGLVLEIDGDFVPLRLAPDRPPRTRMDHHALIARVHLLAPTPGPGVHELHLSDHNYPDLPGWFAWTVHVGPRVEVLPPLEHAEGAWQAGDAHRATTVLFHLHEGPIWRLRSALLGDALRPARHAVRQRLPQAWWRGGLSPAVLLALALAALGTGVAGGVPVERLRLGPAGGGLLLLAAAAAGSLLPTAWSTPILGLLGGAAVVLAILVRDRALAALAPAGLGVVLAAFLPGPSALLAGLVAIGALAGVVLPARATPRLQRGLAATLGLLLALRAAGTWLA